MTDLTDANDDVCMTFNNPDVIKWIFLFQKHLKNVAQEFSEFLNCHDDVRKMDYEKFIIMESGFFVLLVKININHFLKFLQFLMDVYKIKNSVLSKACQSPCFNGQTVVSIIEKSKSHDIGRVCVIKYNFQMPTKNSKSMPDLSWNSSINPQIPRKMTLMQQRKHNFSIFLCYRKLNFFYSGFSFILQIFSPNLQRMNYIRSSNIIYF